MTLLRESYLLDTATLDVRRSDARLLAHPPCCHVAGGLLTWTRLYPSTVQLRLLTASPHCPGVTFVRWCCPCLDVSGSTLLQSTLVRASVADAPPCSLTVLSCGWWSVRHGCGCGCPVYSCHDERLISVMVLLVSRRLLPLSLSRPTSVCPSIVDGGSTVLSACTPVDACTLRVDYRSRLASVSCYSTRSWTTWLSRPCRGCGPSCR